MFIAGKILSIPCDLNSKAVVYLTQSVKNFHSTPYVVTLDRNINAQSILGLLSANIKRGDSIRIQTVSNRSQEEAENDLLRFEIIFSDMLVKFTYECED